ncbi:11-beta-hydroxysteroid dehydrogenase B [Mercurialis annua]|uniref:11-beta-hydroxysteroid dehydrogenase B n=1 Tax=Mercurialis annua TaxID=3986 RepID=UPI00215F8896|nr:11-beta-hydroxysteroid dehydrogenase B [Mercurialis annua]
MDLFNTVMNWVVPPASLVMLACSWPALFFINTCEWLYRSYYSEDMEDKVVIITGASSGIGEQIAYEYAKRKANLVLIARRELRLRGISEKASHMGAKNVIFMAADVVKEDDCRKFVNETINFFGRVDHLVNTATLGHTFYVEEVTDTAVFPHLMDINFWGNVYPTFAALPYLHRTNGRIIINAAVENWLPLPRMSLYAAAKAAVVNFYEALRYEMNGDVGITIATHGWIGSEMSRGMFRLEEGAEMQWIEEREVQASGSSVEEYAKLIVSGACRGDQYVKFPSWYDIFLLYRQFAPNVLNWTFRLLLARHSARRTSLVGTGRPTIEGSPPRKLLTSPTTKSPASPMQMQKLE